MVWWQADLWGGAGGGLFEVLAVFAGLAAWQRARRTRSGQIRVRKPQLRRYVDWPAHAWMSVARVLIGMGAVAAFGHAGRLDVTVALALGFMGPSVLANIGLFFRMSTAVAGVASEDDDRADPLAEVDPEQLAVFLTALAAKQASGSAASGSPASGSPASGRPASGSSASGSEASGER